MIRYVCLLLDQSDSMKDKDIRPSRGLATLDVAEEFVRRFFDQNPISNLGIVLARNGKAEVFTPVSSNANLHAAALLARKEEPKIEFSGVFSLQNSLEICRTLLSPHAVPAYGHKEVLIVSSALSTCDPGNIDATIALLKKEKIRVSSISLSAEVRYGSFSSFLLVVYFFRMGVFPSSFLLVLQFFFRRIARKASTETGGDYGVALNEDHFRDLVYSKVTPPPIPRDALGGDVRATMLLMGFPKLKVHDPTLTLTLNPNP
jgi:transcription initiation factor TFIIH subunit 2